MTLLKHNIFWLKKLYRSLVCRSYSESTPLSSLREKSFKDVQENYAKYEYIVYSSYLETEMHVNLSFRKRKWLHQLQSNNKTLKMMTKHLNNAMESFNDSTEKSVHTTSYPKNWMDDYEFYEGSSCQSENNTINGTADATVPPSQVPCSGCGAHLHCTQPKQPGYIPVEIFKGRTETELKTIICQRCHFLKRYNIALDVEVTSEFYEKTIESIRDKFALAVVIIDLLDMPCSIWPKLPAILGARRPVFILGNKVDLLPKDSDHYLEEIMKCMKTQVEQFGFEPLNVKYYGLISAKTGYGIEEFITNLHSLWAYKGNVYLLGCTNVGKSSLFNILLNSDYCRPEASSLIRKATICPWPGTTMQMLKFPIFRPSDVRVKLRTKRLFNENAQKAAEKTLRRAQTREMGLVRSVLLKENVGRTYIKPDTALDAFAMPGGTKPLVVLNERCKEYQQARWCFDTPGVLHPGQFTNSLTAEELTDLEPTGMIRPRGLRLKTNHSVFIGGIGRLDLINQLNSQQDWIKIFIFSSIKIPLVVTLTTDAEEMYRKYIGTEILRYPFCNEKRLKLWPGLMCTENEFNIVGHNCPTLISDIVFTSIGWIGIKIPPGSACLFKAWTPNGRGVYVRNPPLIPYAERLIGKRVANSLAYNISKPFVLRK